MTLLLLLTTAALVAVTVQQANTPRSKPVPVRVETRRRR